MLALTDVQQSLNIVRQSADRAEWDMCLEILQLTVAAAADILVLSRKLTEPKQRSQTKSMQIPQTEPAHTLLSIEEQEKKHETS